MNAQQTAKCGKVLNSKKCYVMSMLCQVTEANSKKFCFNATCTCSGPNVHTAEKNCSLLVRFVSKVTISVCSYLQEDKKFRILCSNIMHFNHIRSGDQLKRKQTIKQFLSRVEVWRMDSCIHRQIFLSPP